MCQIEKKKACIILLRKFTHQMSKFYRETPIRGFFNWHGFDMSSTKDKSSIAREEILAIYMVSGNINDNSKNNSKVNVLP